MAMSNYSKDDRVFVIAEAGVNHNGSIDMARRLVDSAAEAGADAVKFQTFHASELVSRHAPKAEYQTRMTKAGESQLEMVRKLELSEADHETLISHAGNRGIAFLSTPFDVPSLHMLTQRFDLKTIKVPSGEITNGPFLLEIARTGRQVILSTGMSTLAEVETALSVLAHGYVSMQDMPSLDAFREAFRSIAGQEALHRNVTLLHCTTEYPAVYEDVNLRAMDTLRTAFGLPVGLSDHTPGVHVAVAAVARGAAVIEKHITLDRNLTGPDHHASLEPGEFRQLVTAIRHVEAALGSAAKAPARGEIANVPAARRSLVAARDIRHGETFTVENIAVKRPGTGISPMHYWAWLGKTADRDYRKDDLL